MTVTVTRPWGRITPDGRARVWSYRDQGGVLWGWECLPCGEWRDACTTEAAALAWHGNHWVTWCYRPGAPRPTRTAGVCRPKGTT